MNETSTTRLFLNIFIPYSLIVAAAMVLFVYFQHQQQTRLVQTNELTQISLVKKSLYRDLESIKPDIEVLLNSSSFHSYLNNPTPKNRLRLTEDLMSFALHEGVYDSIRFLDVSGQEVIRIDYDGHEALVTPAALLQDKGNRYYFKETLLQPPGALYISPIDLNVEHDSIERPFKPTIRYGAQVIDEQGRLRGALILNYLAENMLAHFDEMLAGSAGHVALLNNEGYWLRSHKKEREWGFMFGRDETYATHHPEAWPHILSKDDGQTRTDIGLFTHTTVYPKSIGGGAPGDYRWKVVSDVPQLNLQQDFLQYIKGVPGITLLAALIIGAMTSWEIARNRADHRRMREQINLHAQVYKATTDGIVITNTKGSIIDVNDAFSEITGYRREDVIGQNPSMLSSGEHGKEFYKRMWSELMRTGHWQGEITNRKKDGGIFIEWLRISAVRDSHGNTRQFVGVISDITAKKQSEEELHRHAHYDVLTGLPNRLSFEQILEQELNHSDRDGTELALLYIDLDRFKPINDSYGHLTGDVVLKVVAKRLSSVIRKADSIARFGGDEFVAILSGVTDRAMIEEIVERMQAEMRKPIEVEGNEHVIGASIGIAIYPTDTRDVSKLIVCADEAMYRAKQNEDSYHSYCRITAEMTDPALAGSS